MTKIEWCDETINPIIGCNKISPACDHCYAEIMANRLTGIDSTRHYYSQVINKKHWNGITVFRSNELLKPFKWKKSKRIFVVSMGDLFHESVPFEIIDKIITVIACNQQHIFQILTKRPERALEYFNWKEPDWANPGMREDQRIRYYCYHNHDVDISHLDWHWPLQNLWIGVTVEDQERTKRIDELIKIPAVIHFISVEPILEHIDLEKWLSPCSYYCSHSEADFAAYTSSDEFSQFDEIQRSTECALFYLNNHRPEQSKIDWVICGAETGNKARLMDPKWVRSLRDQCHKANVPFFFKKWGALNRDNNLLDGFIDCQEYHEFPNTQF
jgi:protein gp37